MTDEERRKRKLEQEEEDEARRRWLNAEDEEEEGGTPDEPDTPETDETLDQEDQRRESEEKKKKKEDEDEDEDKDKDDGKDKDNNEDGQKDKKDDEDGSESKPEEEPKPEEGPKTEGEPGTEGPQRPEGSQGGEGPEGPQGGEGSQTPEGTQGGERPQTTDRAQGTEGSQGQGGPQGQGEPGGPNTGGPGTDPGADAGARGPSGGSNGSAPGTGTPGGTSGQPPAPGGEAAATGGETAATAGETAATTAGETAATAGGEAAATGAAAGGEAAAGGAAGAAGGIGALGWVALIILAIVIIIGWVGFFIGMPNLVSRKISDFLDKVEIAFNSNFSPNGAALEMVTRTELNTFATHLEDKGVDLLGEGFYKGLVYRGAPTKNPKTGEIEGELIAVNKEILARGAWYEPKSLDYNGYTPITYQELLEMIRYADEGKQPPRSLLERAMGNVNGKYIGETIFAKYSIDQIKTMIGKEQGKVNNTIHTIYIDTTIDKFAAATDKKTHIVMTRREYGDNNTEIIENEFEGEELDDTGAVIGTETESLSESSIYYFKSPYLAHYIAAENATYMVRNFHTDKTEALTSFNVGSFFGPIGDIVGRVLKVNNNPEEGSGLIYFVTDQKEYAKYNIVIPIDNQAGTNAVGKEIKLHGVGKWNDEQIIIDRENKFMELKNYGDGLFSYTKTKFSTDGWIGAYGMPNQLSLAFHLSTLAPDFALMIALNAEYNTRLDMGIAEIESPTHFMTVALEVNGEMRDFKVEAKHLQFAFDGRKMSNASDDKTEESVEGEIDSETRTRS